MGKQKLSVLDAAALVEKRLRLPEETTSRPVLILVSGLPGTGKSHFSRLISRALPVAVVETDFVRKTLFRPPTYSAGESAFVYGVCHALIDSFLSKGMRVLFDATNLQESNRELIYRIADRAEARLIIVRTLAPEDVIRSRLERRRASCDPDDLSDADELVYAKMKPKEEPIQRDHFLVDTSKDFTPVVDRIVREARRQG